MLTNGQAALLREQLLRNKIEMLGLRAAIKEVLNLCKKQGVQVHLTQELSARLKGLQDNTIALQHALDAQERLASC
jgi:hypothetical protein